MKLFAFVVFSFLVASCSRSPGGDYNKALIIEQIDSSMNRQERAWNRGDIEAFMEPYWHSDSLKFIGSSGLTKGWDRTIQNYRKGYPDLAAMGQLRFTNYDMDVLDSNHTYVIGRWQLFRISDTLQGHYSLLWKKLDGNWVIVADHSS